MSSGVCDVVNGEGIMIHGAQRTTYIYIMILFFEERGIWSGVFFVSA